MMLIGVDSRAAEPSRFLLDEPVKEKGQGGIARALAVIKENDYFLLLALGVSSSDL
jgi:hypothetical protein